MAHAAGDNRAPSGFSFAACPPSTLRFQPAPSWSRVERAFWAGGSWSSCSPPAARSASWAGCPRLIRASLDDAAAVRAACAGVDTVFHVGAKVGVWGKHDDFYRVNVLGTRAVLEGCREQGVRRLVFTSTPSVVYNGRSLAGADESLPLTTSCPSPYPLTKAMAEREVLAANSPALRTVALRPHLIWGVGDPHLVPRILQRAAEGRLRIVGTGENRVDMVHVANAVDAHLLAERALAEASGLPPSGAAWSQPNLATCRQIGHAAARPVEGRAFFITNGEPVVLWSWINELLQALGKPTVTKRISLRAASAIGAGCELAWRALPLRGEPPMTRFVAAELAKDHWFDVTAARRDLGYAPRVSMADGTAQLVAHLRARGA
jgi:nucleoside-diphosphate-sugar epimerase